MRTSLGSVAVCVATFLALIGGGVASASGGPSWSTWESQAEAAIGSKTGSQVEITSSIGQAVSTTVQTVTGGTVQAFEQSYLASMDGTSFFVGLTVLGGGQLLVDYWEPRALVVEVLSLAPGSTEIASATQLQGQMEVQDASGNCYPIAYNPAVIGSIYGPLIEGIGGAGCSYAPEVLGAIVSLYSNGSVVGGATGGSSSPNAVYTYIAPYDYYPCYAASAASPFVTAVIYSVGSSIAGSGTSGSSSLDCQP